MLTRDDLAGLTQEDIAEMGEADLAALAAFAPEGFTAVISEGRFLFYATSELDRLSPSRRAVTILARMH